MGRYGMAGDHYRQSGYVTLQDVPDPNREYVESFQNLTGGINRFDLDYRLKGNESPFLQNLSWHNGTLTSRLGQVEKYDVDQSVAATSPFLWHGWLLLHANRALYAVKIQSESGQQDEGTIVRLQSPLGSQVSVNTYTPGTFFQYREWVFYKTDGYYMKMEWDATSDTLTASTVASGDAFSMGIGGSAYVPVVQINTDPVTGAGDQEQQENRLTPRKTVKFNVPAGTTVFHLPEAYKNIATVGEEVIDNGVKVERTNYSVDTINGVLTFTGGYTPTEGQNTLAFTFSKANPEAINSLLDTTAAIVFGGAQDLCVVMGGPKAQPNAYFWSGLGKGDAMDPTYFPMNQYNLAGDNDDPITAFGKQQNMLVIFQPHATGRAVFGTATVNGFDQVTMNYTRINAEIGCDLPGSLQLVENNLVWCNRRYGVCRLKDSSAAYENNIVQISRKINGDYRIEGLLEELKAVADDEVRSVDTGKRYILVLGDQDGKAYEWNYELSKYEDPSWFFHTNILGVGFVPLANEELYEVTADGKVCAFEMVFSDFGTEPINKIYRFPPRDFGSYDRLKNIKSILVTTRSDAKTNTQLKYTCDYAERIDPTNLVVILNRLLYAAVFRRKPGYHNIHHLGIELSNNVAGDDLNIVSAQIYYEYRGRTR